MVLIVKPTIQDQQSVMFRANFCPDRIPAFSEIVTDSLLSHLHALASKHNIPHLLRKAEPNETIDFVLTPLHGVNCFLQMPNHELDFSEAL